jgi:deazaflavin-dependent oxidoreductase (nitroreductase family)
MTEEEARALAVDSVIDITTTGRKTGELRRIEIWFHRVDGRFFITGTPGQPRSWYANLIAHPEFTFHLKGTVVADLAAIARPVTTTAEREEIFAVVLPRLGDLVNKPEMAPAVWLESSPLVEVTFTS